MCFRVTKNLWLAILYIDFPRLINWMAPGSHFFFYSLPFHAQCFDVFARNFLSIKWLHCICSVVNWSWTTMTIFCKPVFLLAPSFFFVIFTFLNPNKFSSFRFFFCFFSPSLRYWVHFETRTRPIRICVPSKNWLCNDKRTLWTNLKLLK